MLREGYHPVHQLLSQVTQTIEQRSLRASQVVLLVSGGSDSTALAYLCSELRDLGYLDALEIIHVNHHLRGRDSDKDAEFVRQLGAYLDIAVHVYDWDGQSLNNQSGKNLEEEARLARYRIAYARLRELCGYYVSFESAMDQLLWYPEAEVARLLGRQTPALIYTAHTLDDRIENFFMRSLVGTGPGGLRAMDYRAAYQAHPLLDVTRKDLRSYLETRAEAGSAMRDEDTGGLWREDGTNAIPDKFRTFVRHCLVPPARDYNPHFPENLRRTMNLIGQEHAYLDQTAFDVASNHLVWLGGEDERPRSSRDGGEEHPRFDREGEGSNPPFTRGEGDGLPQLLSDRGDDYSQLVDEGGVSHSPRGKLSDDARAMGEPSDEMTGALAGMQTETSPLEKTPDFSQGFLLRPGFGEVAHTLQQRIVHRALHAVLGSEARVSEATVKAVLDAFSDGRPRSGYVTNIQGNLAVSSNKHGVRVEPMEIFRTRRKRIKSNKN